MNAIRESHRVVVGIDVGAERKGLHAVALKDGQFLAALAARETSRLTDWLMNEIRPQVVAVDAPCRWSADGRPRACERELRQAGISCFATPTRDAAVSHPTNYFGWMLRGEQVFAALEARYPLIHEVPVPAGDVCCFETFPHAVCTLLTGRRLRAKDKRADRIAVLASAGIETHPLATIDDVDAAVCALAAHHVAARLPCRTFGDLHSGFLIVPSPG